MSHFSVSIVKSILRIGGCAFLIYEGDIIPCAWAFLVAEILGVVEEFADKRKENV